MLGNRHALDGSAEAPVLSLAEARAALEPGTRLVVYSIGLGVSLIAVVFDADHEGPGIEVHHAPLSHDELAAQVELFRALLERGPVTTEPEPALVEHGAELYEKLFGPVEAALEGAERIVIVPDTPLYSMPFAALVRSRHPLRFVGEWKPISFAVSATTFAAAQARRKPGREERSIAVFATTDPSRLGVDADLPDGLGPLTPLPGVEHEARMLGQLFATSSTILLDLEAREAAVETTAREADFLHFATHARIDSKAPQSSYLLLAAGDGEDGRLSAQEIIEEHRFDNDLVTLSACDTGRGRELSGEGVLGLSHAFLFAGARTILVSLWPVADDSTAFWMHDFYEGLGPDRARDEAVLRAQRRALAGSTERRHPYHWAGFQLWGDWSG